MLAPAAADDHQPVYVPRPLYLQPLPSYVQHSLLYTRYVIQNAPQWQSKKQLRRWLDNERCRNCGADENLDVHHWTYAHLGNEPLENLITLCRPCHDWAHGKPPWLAAA